MDLENQTATLNRRPSQLGQSQLTQVSRDTYIQGLGQPTPDSLFTSTPANERPRSTNPPRDRSRNDHSAAASSLQIAPEGGSDCKNGSKWLDFLVVESDGGNFSEEYAITNALRNDTSVYCSRLTEYQLVVDEEI